MTRLEQKPYSFLSDIFRFVLVNWEPVFCDDEQLERAIICWSSWWAMDTKKNVTVMCESFAFILTGLVWDSVAHLKLLSRSYAIRCQLLNLSRLSIPFTAVDYRIRQTPNAGNVKTKDTNHKTRLSLFSLLLVVVISSQLICWVAVEWLQVILGSN